jgi:hypothetical protein
VHSISSAVLLGLAVGAIHWFGFQARWARPRVRGECTEYSISLSLRLVLLAGISLLVYGSISNAMSERGEKWVSLLLAGVAFFCFYFTPPTIVDSQDAIASMKWFGIGRVSMAWSEVVSVYLDPESNSLIIRDKRDRTIEHTTYNVGRGDLVRKISELPYDFARQF